MGDIGGLRWVYIWGIEVGINGTMVVRVGWGECGRGVCGMG